MAITRSAEVRVADVYADDDGGVTVVIPKKVARFTIIEASESAKQIAVAVEEALQDDGDAAVTLADLRARLTSPAAAEGVF